MSRGFGTSRARARETLSGVGSAREGRGPGSGWGLPARGGKPPGSGYRKSTIFLVIRSVPQMNLQK
jgi:hypothetical protein